MNFDSCPPPFLKVPNSHKPHALNCTIVALDFDHDRIEKQYFREKGVALKFEKIPLHQAFRKQRAHNHAPKRSAYLNKEPYLKVTWTLPQGKQKILANKKQLGKNN